MLGVERPVGRSSQTGRIPTCYLMGPIEDLDGRQKWDPHAGSQPPSRRQTSAAGSVFTAPLSACRCNKPLPVLNSLLNSLLGSGQQQDGCLQRGEWAGRVETRSLKGPASGTDRTGYQNQLCLFLAPLSIWSVGCSGSGAGVGVWRSWMGEARLKVCPQLPHLQGQVCPGVTPGKRGRWAAAPGGARVPGRHPLSPPLSPPSA